MSLATTLEKIAAHKDKYSCMIERLGECKIASPLRHNDFIGDGDDSRVLVSANALQLLHLKEILGDFPSFELAGPHKKIFHDPAWTRAGIVTAGGLCPGLNNVIKGLVEILCCDYGVKTVYGIRYGYAGLVSRSGYEPMLLTPEGVDTIHEWGGTILGSSRGQQSAEEMVDTLERMNINVLFCVGGDGSLRCARTLADECRRRKLKVSVVGVPKTIDNDLQFIGRSFGFETSVGVASGVITQAHVEAKGTPNGIGLVKLMGRDSGFITAYATVANPVVNFCLVPEKPFELEGPHGLLQALERRFAEGKGHAVIAVAEGAGQNLIAGESAKDASGNVLKKDIGVFLKDRIASYFKEKGISCSVKYFDPSYTIRSVPAHGTDAVRCYLLARNAVHAAMAGRTNCVVGSIDENFTLVPISLATIERQTLSLTGALWRSVIGATRQESYFSGTTLASVVKTP